jgi:aspartate kinase
MALIVQKYGGTSVGTVERIQGVAQKVKGFREQGHDVVVVVSAMSGETNRLIGMANEISQRPVPREMDVLVSTGEQVTIALLAMALTELGCAAKSYTGGQVRIHTDSAHTKARIQAIDDENMRADLKAGRVVIVAGFQGMDDNNNITTLGRGGSDTTAVALAVLLSLHVDCPRSPLRRCLKWRLLVQKFYRFGRSNLPANTMCRFACYQPLKMAQVR